MLIQRATMLDGAVVDIRVGERIDEVADTLAPGPVRTCWTQRAGPCCPDCTTTTCT